MITKIKQSRKEIIEKINYYQLLNNLETAFLGIKTGTTVQPNQFALVAPNNDDCIVYSAADFKSNIVGVKLSPFVSSRGSRNLNPVTAYTLLLSMNDGEPLIICDSVHLTAIRTAATSILAISKLKPNTQKLSIIGFGPIGQEHLRGALIKFTWENICIYSPTISKDNKKGYDIIEENNINQNNSKITFSETIDECINDATVIMLCTSSKKDIIDLKNTVSNSVITSIVTNSTYAHEVVPESLQGCNVYCDYLPNCLEIAGEFKILKELNKLNTVNIVGDLPALCDKNSNIDVNPNSKRYFRSVGLGIEDIIIANSLL
jgi:L-arginine dehydrogenase